MTMDTVKTQDEYTQVLERNALVLTYITGTNCGVCSSVKPKIEAILAEYPELHSVEINSHENQELAAQLSIFSIPAVLIHLEGKETIREARYFSIQELESRIDRLVGLYSRS